MATLLEQQNIQRPTGTGFEGQGPAINLPSVDKPEEPLRITVGKQKQEMPAEPAPNTNWSKINEALSQGYSREEVSKYLQDDLGVDPDEADKQLIDSVRHKIKTAKEQGYSDAEVKDYLIQNKYDGSVIDNAMQSAATPKPWKKYEWDPQTKVEDAKDITSLYNNIYGKYSTMGKQIGGIFDEQMGIEARRDINALNATIAGKLKEQNIDAYIDQTTGDLMMRDETGFAQEIDSSFVNDFFNSKSEITGAIAGGIAGAKLGAQAPGRAKAYTVPLGAVAGSMMGAAAGKAADMTINAALLKEQLSAKLYMTQMTEAGIFDGIAGVLGTSVFKLGGSGLKQVMRAYDFMSAGNSKGAYKALLDNMEISDEQALEIVKQWEAFNQKKLTKVQEVRDFTSTGLMVGGGAGLVTAGVPGAIVLGGLAAGAGKAVTKVSNKLLANKEVEQSLEEKAISIIASTQPGAENYVKMASANNPKLATSVIKDIDARAKGLTNAIDTVADENIGATIQEGLKAYRSDVKEFYGTVKEIGSHAIDGTDFRFDLEKLAIEPVVKSIEKQISNPIMKERFVLYASRIESASKDRTFNGLLELRQAVNDFKYSKSGLNKTDIDALNAVINRIDGQIGKAVKEYMPETGKDWLQQFSKAKTEYAKMKQLESNVLFKALNRKGITEEQIQKLLAGKINALDTTFDEVLEKLPKAARAKTEGAVIKLLTDKYTLGEAVDQQAIHFPALADALKKINIQTKDAKNLVRTIDEMAKIFKNDINLSKVSGNIALPKFQSYLTVDPVVRAKYEIASSFFNTVKRFVPGKEANNLALLHKVDKLLENPLHARTADDFIKSMPKEEQQKTQYLVQQLQIELAKNPAPVASWKNMFKQSTTGKLTVSEGKLGKGVYLSDKVKPTDPSAKVIKHEVNMSKMATLEDISNVVGKEFTEADFAKLSKEQKAGLNQALQDKGYLGISVNDKAMLFPETTKGVTTPKPKPTVETNKESLDKALTERVERGGLTSGQGTATKEYNKMNDIIKKLNSGTLNAEGIQTFRQQADELGFNVYKRTQSGKALNSNGLNGKWVYARKKGK